MAVVRSTLGERKWSAVRAWSIVQEHSDQVDPYEHTHAAFMLDEPIDLTGNDLFELPVLEAAETADEESEGEPSDPETEADATPKRAEGHPHINHSKSLKWLENLETRCKSSEFLFR